MGTQDPLVRIEAATLAGGENNQDRYAHGDGWAFVLDGASAFSETPQVHDGGWYAQRLKNALEEELATNPKASTVDIVAGAIQQASAAHNEDTQGPCPTSTIALARWSMDEVELYVLGDSIAAIVHPAGRVASILEDSRIRRWGVSARRAYRLRLQKGYGFDRYHLQLLAELQLAQSAGRNRVGGYWVAGDSTEAAHYALCQRSNIADGMAILLATDGVYGVCGCRKAAQGLACASNLGQQLREVHAIESGDPQGLINPRSKIHDDKSAIRITFEFEPHAAPNAATAP